MKKEKTFMGLKVSDDTETISHLLGFEPYFGCYKIVATVFHDMKMVIPAHGYFKPHKYGIISEKYAIKIGYIFNND